MEPGELTIAGIVLIVVSLVLLIVDIVLYVQKKRTISQVITGFSYYSPMGPLVLGILLGHWFW